jgi:protein PhnA
MSLPKCPKCSSIYVYEDGNLLVCPECAYELTGAYKTQPNFQRYIEHKSDKLREQGITVDIWK